MDKQETRSLYFLCMGWHRSAVLNFLLGKFEFEQFCLHANHFLLFACPLPPVTALFVNLSTQPTMCQQKGSSICLSVFLFFFQATYFACYSLVPYCNPHSTASSKNFAHMWQQFYFLKTKTPIYVNLPLLTTHVLSVVRTKEKLFKDKILDCFFRTCHLRG